MRQAHLFPVEPPQPRSPIARQTDPVTSHEAAAEVTASGLRDTQAAAILAAVRAHPGQTSRELATVFPAADQIDRYVTGRRLPELEQLGLVVARGRHRRDEARICRVSRRLAVTWWPVEIES